MDFFTADLHLGHDKNFIWSPRGFTSIEEQDKEILKRWNSIVTPNDTVYLLGDIAFGLDEKVWKSILWNLNGKIYFLPGNHDSKEKVYKYKHECPLFLITYPYYSYKKYKFVLSHYPSIMDSKYKPNLWNLSGHTHSNDKFQYGQFNIYNVALNAHNNTPVSIEQIIKDIKKYQEETQN